MIKRLFVLMLLLAMPVQAANVFTSGGVRTVYMGNLDGNATLAANQCYGSLMHNSGVSAEEAITITLPDAEPQMILTVWNTVDEIITLIPASGDTIDYDGADADDEMDSDGVIGSQIVIVCLVANTWEVFGTVGTWTKDAK